MTNSLTNDLYRCVVQLKSGKRHILEGYEKRADIVYKNELIMQPFGLVEVETVDDDTISFIRTSEIECITWELLKFADTKNR